MQKRGQFYIIAAVIIAGLIIGLATVENKAYSYSDVSRFYDFSDNFEEESVRVIDHGLYTSESKADIERKMYDFYDNFSKSALANDPDINLVFVYGDSEKAIVGKMDETEASTHLLGLQDGKGIEASSVIKEPTVYPAKGDKVRVQINEEDSYEFNLNNEEGFYFMIMTEKNGEVLVSKNG